MCILKMVQITWSERKRKVNLKKHDLDFMDAESVLSGLTLSFADERFDYGERRFITIGMIDNVVVLIAHTETEDEIRVISMRKATKDEEKIFFESISN